MPIRSNSGMKTDFCKKIWKVRRAVAWATFAREAPGSLRIFHITGLNNHPISVKHKPKHFENLKSHISNKMHFQEGPCPPSPLKNFFADLHWSQEWSWELEKNLKSDNYLKIFIPDVSIKGRVLEPDVKNEPLIFNLNCSNLSKGDVTSMFSRLWGPGEHIFKWTLLNWPLKAWNHAFHVPPLLLYSNNWALFFWWKQAFIMREYMDLCMYSLPTLESGSVEKSGDWCILEIAFTCYNFACRYQWISSSQCSMTFIWVLDKSEKMWKLLVYHHLCSIAQAIF